jgi:hypothetical protein
MKPIERVMQTYGMMVTLTAEQEDAVRERLEKFLASKTGTDQELAIQGLRFLRGTHGPKRGKPISRRILPEEVTARCKDPACRRSIHRASPLHWPARPLPPT